MELINHSIYKLLFAGWLGVFLFWLAGVPEGSYQQLDVNMCIWITNMLQHHPYIAKLLYNFNSISEIYINLVTMLVFMVLSAMRQHGEARYENICKIICAFIWVEFWILCIINPFISQFLTLDVNLVPEVSTWINETNRIVDNETTLISRHVFTMLFLAWYYLNGKKDCISRVIIYFCAIVFSVAPILNAHHWMSDFLFSSWLAFSCVHFSKLFKLDYILFKRLFQNK